MKGYNIYLRKDGRWEGRIPKPSVNGKRKYKSFFGTSKEAVRRMIDDFYREQTKDVSLRFTQIYQEFHDLCDMQSSSTDEEMRTVYKAGFKDGMALMSEVND